MDQQQARNIADRFIAELHRVEKGEAAGIDNLVDLFADNAELTNTIIEREGSNRSVGTGTAGQPLAYEGVSLLVFNDAGKIARFRGYFDSRQMTLRAEPRSPHHA